MDNERFLVFLPIEETAFFKCEWWGVAGGGVQACVQASDVKDQ